MNDIPTTIGTKDTYKKCYFCKLCHATHAYGDIWLEHKDYRDEDVIYENWEEYRDKY